MSVAVGRRVYSYTSGRSTFVDPKIENFTTILSLTKSSAYGSLSPYELRDDRGFILENVWQFGKIYDSVPMTKVKVNSYSSEIAWEWPSEVHWDCLRKEPTPAYWRWREQGMACQYPVRYPVGFKHRGECRGYVVENKPCLDASPVTILDYITARKQVYVPLFQKAVVRNPSFDKLQKRLQRGENLLVVEVDGPHQESLQYYVDKYNVSADFIVENTIQTNERSLVIMLEDALHPFGHGYCLAASLLNINLTNNGCLTDIFPTSRGIKRSLETDRIPDIKTGMSCPTILEKDDVQPEKKKQKRIDNYFINK